MGYEIWSKKGWLVAQELNEPHAELFREAGNVVNRTGHTPEEMAELLRESLTLINKLWDSLKILCPDANPQMQYVIHNECLESETLLKKLEVFK